MGPKHPHGHAHASTGAHRGRLAPGIGHHLHRLRGRGDRWPAGRFAGPAGRCRAYAHRLRRSGPGSVGRLLATRAASARRTFGLQRAEVLAALTNVLLLVGVAVWVLIRAVDRLREPAEVDTGQMLVVAILGALANSAGLVILRRGRDESLNVRGAYLEVLADLLGSVAVIGAAISIMITGWTRFDVIASLLIFALILPRALIREVVDVLLEATPQGEIWTRSGSTSSGWSTCTT